MAYYKHKDKEQKIYDNGNRDASSEYVLFYDSINDRLKQEKLVGCEIGVLYGDTSMFFLQNFTNLFLIGIDPIIPDSMESSLIGNVETIKLNTKEYENRFQFIQDYSFNVSFEEDYFDFIFIDGDHNYEVVKSDFEQYVKYLKKGGLMFFHDSRMNRGGANFHIGSSKFVDELISSSSDLELIGETFSLTCFVKN
jgi:hypothetical protein